MNINLSNNTLLQGMSQDPGNSFSQTSASPKTYLQLSDGRYVQIAQNLQPAQHQLPTTILVQMPYKLLDQPGLNANQGMMNKRFLLPSKLEEKSPQNSRYVTVNNPNISACNNFILSGQQSVDQAPLEFQNPPLIQQNGQNLNGNIIALDKYQEICDMLQSKKLLTKIPSNDETVLVEFRLNQQKYQLRMTRDQKVDMERLLISAGNQQRQMEILQVYQSEQRKNMQQRTSVVLNQIINKPPSTLVCNSPQIQSLNITKPIYPLNSVLVAVPQTQYTDGTMIQPQTMVQQQKCVSMQPTVSIQNPNGITPFNARIPTAQSSIMSVPTIPQDKSISKQKRISKAPNPANCPQTIPNLNSNQEMKPARSRRYNNMRKILFDDQNAVMMPDCSNCFEDLHDVARRLLPYHILEESKDQKFDEVDRILSDNFADLNRRCNNLKRVASSISMHDVISDNDSERLLIKRMQFDLEMDAFAREQAEAMSMEQSGAVASFTDDMLIADDGDVIVIEDSPPLSPCIRAAATTSQLCPPDTMEPLPSSSPLLDRSLDSVAMSEHSGQDSLGNYDIQDISNDSLDWARDDQGVPAYDTTGQDNNVYRDDNEHRSEEPDLEEAIKSILF